MRSLLLWSVWCVAFSPVFADLVEHWWREPWPRYSSLFVPLFVLAAARSPEPEAPRPRAQLWLGLALLIELATAATDLVRFARPAVALAAFGLCRGFGLRGARASLLLLFAVPIPYAVQSPLGPGLQEAWARIATAPLGLMGFDVSLWDADLTVNGHMLELPFVDTGLCLLAGLAGVGLFAALQRGAGALDLALATVRWAAVGIPVHLAGLVLAAAATAAGRPEAARVGLDTLPLLATFTAACAACWPLRTRGRSVD